jgi:RNA polymerase sigma factor (sigma-70 family)
VYCQLQKRSLVIHIMAGVAPWGWSMTAVDESELVRRAKCGDRIAAELLLSRHDSALYRICRHLLPGGEDVEATVQEALLKALKSLERYSGTGSFGGWLAAIAVNLCRDRMRRRRLIPFVALEVAGGDELDPLAVVPTPEPSPERVAMAREAVTRVRREVRALPARQREVFVLRFFAGMELEGIAATLGVDLGTVKTHLHRAVHRVRAAAEEAMP